MSFLKRAILSVLYYWKTSVLLIVLFTAIAALLLSGLCIKDAAQQKTVSIRRSLGGSVTVSAELNVMGEAKTPLPLSQVQKIAKLPHVRSSLFVISCAAKPQHLKTLKIVGNTIKNGEILLTGVNDSSRHEKFTDGELYLKSGRAIGENDLATSNTVISEDFANLNKIKLGDKVSAVSGGQTVTLTVVGIFAAKQADNNLSDNSLYVPYTLVHRLIGQKGFFHAVYVMDDPYYISEFRQNVMKLGFGIKASQMNADDYVYNVLSGPINNLNYISSVMVIGLLIAGAVILSLIILLGLRGRKFEIGVLLSIGEKRRKIIAQLAVESIIPILIAFSLSFIIGGISAQEIGDAMFSAQTNSQAQTVSNDGRTYKVSDKIAVTLSPDETGITYLAGILITLASVAVSSVSIMRYKPKDIFSQIE